MKTITQIIALMGLACAIGFANYTFNPNAPKLIGHYPEVSTGDTAQIPESAMPDDPPFISIGEAADMFNTPTTLFVDARDPFDYAQGHIPGAVSVPFEGTEEVKAEFMARTPKDRVMVVYCGGAECDMSLFLGRTLKMAGFTGMRIFFGGWSDWSLKKMPVETGSPAGLNDSSKADKESE